MEKYKCQFQRIILALDNFLLQTENKISINSTFTKLWKIMIVMDIFEYADRDLKESGIHQLQRFWGG